jgi:ketosteroid isomerase-like protein/predicted enzyme related to lactoylglutathione lyase
MPGPFDSTRDVIVRAADFDSAVAFYESVLGLTVSYRGADLVGFDTGAFTLYVEGGAPHGPIFELLVVDLAAAKARLLANGCRIIEEDPGVPRCYIEDPHGFTFNLGKRKYDKFADLDPFFDIVMKGLEGLVDGHHFWDAVAADAIFEFRYRFPGWPERLESRAAYMTTLESYQMQLHSANGLVVHSTRDPGVVVLEYEVHGTARSTGKAYDNRFCSIVTISDRKIVHWRDYMDSLAPVLATSTS